MIDIQTNLPAIESNTEIAKCQACGANMIFSPKAGQLLCYHCTSLAPVRGAGLAVNLPLSKLGEKNEWKNETHIFVCDNCGATEVLSKQEIAKECAFCGATNIVAKKELSGLKPNAVIPFKLEQERAGEIAMLWFKKKWFAPAAFKVSAEAEEIKGIYYPVFAFNASTVSTFSGTLVRYETKTKTVNGKTTTYRVERRFDINGTLPKNFQDILIQAATAIPQRTVNKISPFKLASASSYSQDYLFGFVATQHTKDGQASWDEAKTNIDADIKRSILAQYSYDRIERLSVNTSIHDASFKYSLLPIYLGHTNFKNKLYNFYINGENGRIDAKAPVSAIKVVLTIFFPVGLLVLIGMGIGKLFKKIFTRKKKRR